MFSAPPTSFGQLTPMQEWDRNLAGPESLAKVTSLRDRILKLTLAEIRPAKDIVRVGPQTHEARVFWPAHVPFRS